jgi:hypothetical protein
MFRRCAQQKWLESRLYATCTQMPTSLVSPTRSLAQVCDDPIPHGAHRIVHTRVGTFHTLPLLHISEGARDWAVCEFVWVALKDFACRSRFCAWAAPAGKLLSGMRRGVEDLELNQGDGLTGFISRADMADLVAVSCSGIVTRKNPNTHDSKPRSPKPKHS